MVICDGAPGLNNGIEALWPGIDRQRCTVHRLRNLLAKVPDHLQEAVLISGRPGLVGARP